MFIANIGSLFTLSCPATSRLSATPYLLKLNGATFDVKAAPLRGQRWIRTTEGVSQQIYSLPHLATLVFARIPFSISTMPASIRADVSRKRVQS